MIGYVFAFLKLSGLSRRLQVSLYALAGVVVGMAFVTARVTNATSYLGDAPETCMNCHVMTDAYASWQRGSHGKTAVCTDCHVPHTSLYAKWAMKAIDGTKHTTMFLLRLEPQVLVLSEMATPVVQANCLRCHEDQFVMISSESTQRKCWDCHSNIHGEAHSLSASPQQLRPKMPDAGLDMMK
jgi:cytochrome c nitrite reductase small subunit